MDKQIIIILVQIIIVFAVITIITMLIRVNQTIKLEKRISKYTVRYTKKVNDNSLLEIIWDRYIKFVKRQRKKIRKMFPTLTKMYDKYSVGSVYKAEDLLMHKFIISLVLAVLTIMAMSIQGEIVTVMQLIFSLIIGFYLLDIYLIIARKIKKKKISTDMLRAIIIMNNAFKSGKSTIQAVEVASKKLPKPIGYEFEKINEEMKYGLSIDTVFDRFAKRVGTEEASYLSSSLTILNKTGGNIIAVFDSIEKTLFDKMKLKEELKNLTVVSKLVVRILLAVPILFGLVIYLLNPDYFKPFVESPMGYIMLGIILVLFIAYAYLLSRIVEVEY